ncbi:hypothetical protein BSQ44_13935 [Aquibium oceanicum]|uniref:Glycosyltransferase subfamily 4-like N-terminal domain-containing protein n=2 Tax=Aquibium oceanicum TaxID=1670800 RepID=A0A1L3SSE2_9HYPH|nr:glycosyltransferase [Aquibium oceanicum]APH72337.1 hypothetical protein BSQ44_13935 [Aquibium oceanicum]
MDATLNSIDPREIVEPTMSQIGIQARRHPVAVLRAVCKNCHPFADLAMKCMAPRLLVIDDRTPTPDQDSGSACTFSYLQILAGAGLDLTFLPSVLGDAGHYSDAIRALGVEVPKPATYPSLEAAVDQLAPKSDLVIIFRAPIAQRVFDRIRHAAPRAKIIFHTVDLHHLRMRRQSELAGDPEMANASDAMRLIELDIVARADATIVVSSFEDVMLRGLVADADIRHIPLLREVPKRVGGWSARLSGLFRRRGPLSSRRDIVFVGGFEHAPNGDGVHWFVSQVWPKVLNAEPGSRLVVAGSNLTADIAALACETITPLGHVRDLGALFSTARMSIAPLRYGAGVKGKIVSSLSYEVPVVATRIAAEGTGLVDGVNVLIGDDPQEMADAVVRLLRDDDLWRRLSKAGYRTFIDVHSHTAGRPKIMKLVEDLLR